MAFLGIDLGTSGLRALLVDGEGRPIASAGAHYAVARRHPRWSEQDPADWITALETAVTQLRAKQPRFTDIRGIGIAGHMHGAVLLDEQGEVLRPCILWNDTRSYAEAAAMDAAPDFRAISGNIVFPGFTAPKLEWLRTHEPEVWGQAVKIVLPVAYLIHHLTGRLVGDVSDASGTSWLDTGARQWSPELLAQSGVSADQMPALVEGCAPAASLRGSLAKDWGLSGDVVVAGGAGDNAAAACGMGVTGEGAGFVSLGTSGVVLAARDVYAPAPETALHTFCHAIPARWIQMGVMLSATDSLNWLSEITGATPQALTGELGETLQGPGAARFFPYLSGERTPHNDTDLRGGFVGLDRGTDRNAMVRAVLEGVAFGLRDSYEAIRATGGDVREMYVIGGGAASPYWVKLLATVLKTPLRLPSGGETGAALGAARLAMVATGSEVAAVMTPPVDCDVDEPVAGLIDAFEEAYGGFRSGYTALKALR